MATANDLVLDGIFKILPQNTASPDLRAKFTRLQKDLDGLFFLDAGREVAVDRDAFLALTSNPDYLPADVRDYAVLKVSKHLGRRLNGRKGQSLGWVEVSKYGAPTLPLSPAGRKAIAMKAATQAQVTAVLIEQLPDHLTKEFMAQDIGAAYKSMLRSLKTNRTPWDCIVANLGWWFAITATAAIIIISIMVASGAAFWVIFAAVAAFAALFAAYIIFQCLLNPGYNI